MKVTERFIKNRHNWLVVLFTWSAIVACSAAWNISELEEHAHMMARERGKNFFQMVQLARKWNADYGPVYLPITEQTPPNPYLEIPERDVTTTTGKALTVVNPAYMTRQMAELARQQGFYFHLTSLNPIRPQNEADAWERQALDSFHQGRHEQLEVIDTHNNGSVFRYMAPMRVEAACLGCHAKQGYRLGEIRGGLSVNLDADEIFDSLGTQNRMVIAVHAVAWLAVSALLLAFLQGARNHTLFLEGLNYAKQRDLQHRQNKLAERERVIDDLVNRDTTTGLHSAEHFKHLSSTLWSNAISNGDSVAIILLEIDYFHDYVDNYGALEGDICLKQVSEAIATNVQQRGSIMARFGSASFIIMLSGNDAGRAFDVAEKVHGAVLGMGIPHETSPISRYITITGVVATTRPHSGAALGDFIRKVRLCLGKGDEKARNRIHRC
ncbi:MAG: diguanylate cyclase domain-containing protein [Pseudomonadota bacterium]